jgi:hypothetical protein
MPTRAVSPSRLPELGIKEVYYLITGRQWHFDWQPAFASDADALRCYQQIRAVLHPFCMQHVGRAPWAESLLLQRPGPPMTAVQGFTYETCRQFLSVVYGP